MLMFTEEKLIELDSSYPGIREQILSIEASVIPACTACGSGDTAQVHCGLIGRSISVSAATTRCKLVPNKTASMGEYYCNECCKFFDAGGVENPSDEAA